MRERPVSNPKDSAVLRSDAVAVAQVSGVLRALVEMNSEYVANGMSTEWRQHSIDSLVRLTGSPIGFIASVVHDEAGKPYIEDLTVSGADWGEWTRPLAGDAGSEGFEIHNLESLIGATITSGQRTFSNDPSHDKRSGGVPTGHPDLSSFAGVPVRAREGVVAIVGLANRTGGYDNEVIDQIEPLIGSLGQVLSRDQAVRGKVALSNRHTAITDNVTDLLAASSVPKAFGELRDTTVEMMPGTELEFFAISKSADALEWIDPDASPDKPLKPGPRLRRADCLALTRGVPHASEPNSPPSQRCAHARAGVTTICNPVVSSGSEFGVLIATFPEDLNAGTISEGSPARRLLASALAEVCLRERFANRSLTDDLTGLPNRAAFNQAVHRHLDTGGRRLQPTGVMIVDVDGFKSVNDQFGHQAGDELLRSVGQHAASAMRADDSIARIGGDEFAVLLPSCDEQKLKAASERLRQSIENVLKPDDTKVKVSVGGVVLDEGKTRWSEAYRLADQALYAAKAAGGDQVRIAHLTDD